MRVMSVVFLESKSLFLEGEPDSDAMIVLPPPDLDEVYQWSYSKQLRLLVQFSIQLIIRVDCNVAMIWLVRYCFLLLDFDKIIQKPLI